MPSLYIFACISQELDSFAKKVNVLQESGFGFSEELFAQTVNELVRQFKLLSTAYTAHSEAEDQIVRASRSLLRLSFSRACLQVFPMLLAKISAENQKACTLCSDEHQVSLACT
jgi:hypothetical protein